MSIEREPFTYKKYPNGVYLVRETFYRAWSLANIFVVKGATKDLIIDTGIGLWDLPGFLKNHDLISKKKPYEAVATHIHFDHSGGLHQFENFAIHRLEANAISTGDAFELAWHMTQAEILQPPTPNWQAQDYKTPNATPTRVLDDGDVFDLGNRKIRVLHLPGHTKGSIALYEEDTKSLWTGDIIYQGPIIDCAPTSYIPDYIKACEQLKQLAPYVDIVFPGHGDIFDGKTLDQLLTDYLASKQACCSGVKDSMLRTAFGVMVKVHAKPSYWTFFFTNNNNFKQQRFGNT
ncbi:predicted protein [Nematostella vectensis]|uniref:Metallo-beta-lactamase domain-containing protein n=1 Tax=Nematostella vectensis TaxID=45351 RepID=A7RLS9_NEMVE|nr:predicted protein [Nematostella vectensis]|eukprot:XP_001639810.1 predicted protein [Nematostella vectensis]